MTGIRISRIDVSGTKLSNQQIIGRVRTLLRRQEDVEIARFKPTVNCSLEQYIAYRRNCLSQDFERNLRTGFFERSGVTLVKAHNHLVDRLNNVILPPTTLCYRAISYEEKEDLLQNGSVLFHGYGFSQASLLSFDEVLRSYGRPDTIHCGIIIEVKTGGKFQYCKEYFYDTRVVTLTEHRPETLRIFDWETQNWITK